MLSLYLPKKLTPNFSSSWVRTILDVSLESSPSLKMSEKKIWKRYISSLAKGLSRKSKYRKRELIYLPLRPEFRHPKDQILDPPFLLLYHAFWACTRSRNHSAVTDVLAGVGSVPARVPAQSIVALSPGGELYIWPAWQAQKGEGVGGGRKGKGNPIQSNPILLPFFPSSLSPTPYPFRRLLLRLLYIPWKPWHRK